MMVLVSVMSSQLAQAQTKDKPAATPPKAAAKAPVKPKVPEICTKEAPKVRAAVENCLKVAEVEARRSCFNAIPNSQSAEVKDKCKTNMGKVISAIQAREKELYPDQPSALGRR